MLLTQIEFLVLAAVVLAFVLLVRDNTWRKRFLLVASYYFYAYWDWRFLGLMFSCTAVNHLAALQIAKRPGTRAAKAWVTGAMVFSLGVLGFFKYFNFFVDSLNALIAPLQAGGLSIILPVGISFFTFQTLSYTLDVYRGERSPCSSFPDIALFVPFFPQLVAGPIVRAAEFLPQLNSARTLTWTRGFEGFRQFVFGLLRRCSSRTASLRSWTMFLQTSASSAGRRCG